MTTDTTTDMYLSRAILKLIESIAAEPSKNQKQELLKASGLGGSEITVFTRILYSCYSPRLKYGIEYVDPVPGSESPDAWSVDTHQMWELILALTTGMVTGNAAKDSIVDFLRNATPETGEIFRRIVQKDMRAGFSASTINKVFPKLIEETPYMRCSLPKDVKLDEWNWKDGIYAQLKSDGMFQTVTRIGLTNQVLSRSGEEMPVECIPEILAVLKEFQDDNTRCEGEFVVIDPYGEIVDRATGNGMINSLRQGGELPEDHYIKYVIWDYVDARGGGFEDSRPYKERFDRLIEDFVGDAGHKYVGITPFNVVYSKAEAIEVYKRYRAQNLEGVILKRPDGPYKDGTSRYQVKLKDEKVVDVKIVGFVEGAKGKKTAKTFGSIMFESADGIVRGSTSGLKDKLREEINANREAWIGKIIAVRANALTQNRDEPDKWALSHPRLDEVREDKTTADTFERIEAIFDVIEF